MRVFALNVAVRSLRESTRVYSSSEVIRVSPATLLIVAQGDERRVTEMLCLSTAMGFREVLTARAPRGNSRSVLAIAQLAYEGDEGPELAYRIERFGK
jgi:hypothetical protein